LRGCGVPLNNNPQKAKIYGENLLQKKAYQASRWKGKGPKKLRLKKKRVKARIMGGVSCEF